MNGSENDNQLSRMEMKHIMSEYRTTPQQIERDFKSCCSEHDRCSEDLQKIAGAITALHRMRPEAYVGRVQDMEDAL